MWVTIIINPTFLGTFNNTGFEFLNKSRNIAIFLATAAANAASSSSNLSSPTNQFSSISYLASPLRR